MIKLLIIAYDFPPYVSVGGLRPYSWYKYIKDYGVCPIVVTRQWDNSHGNYLDYVSPSRSSNVEIEETNKGIIIRAPYIPNQANKLLLKYGESKFNLLRRSISACYEVGQFVLPIGPRRSLYVAANKFLEVNRVDCIIATGDPFILFKYASQLSSKYSIPWIADYRDPWVPDDLSRGNIGRAWHAFFQRAYLRNVTKITTVSTFVQKQIEDNINGKSFEIIYNGYDPEISYEAQKVGQNNECLSIAFAGTIYSWHPIKSFLRTCEEILQESPGFQIRLNFYGINKVDEIKAILDSTCRKLKPCVSFHPRIENLKLSKILAEHNAFLLFNYYSYMGTKVFDYLAIRRKIIFCYENDEEANELRKKYYNVRERRGESKSLQADLIRATNSGFVVRDATHLKEILKSLNEEVRENGFIACDSRDIETYSRANQAAKLASLVKSLQK